MRCCSSGSRSYAFLIVLRRSGRPGSKRRRPGSARSGPGREAARARPLVIKRVIRHQVQVIKRVIRHQVQVIKRVIRHQTKATKPAEFQLAPVQPRRLAALRVHPVCDHMHVRLPVPVGASDGGETTFHGKAENPHPKGRPKPGKFRRGPPADAMRALHPARPTGQRQSVVPEMPPVPQEGPLTRPGVSSSSYRSIPAPIQQAPTRNLLAYKFARFWALPLLRLKARL